MNNPARTKAEAILEARYSIRLHELHERFFKRAHGAISLFTVLASSAVIVAALQAIPHAVATLGFLIAAAGFTDILCGLAERAARHDTWQREAADILAESAELTLPALDAALAKFSARAKIDLEALRVVAWNDVLRSNGFEDGVRPEHFLQRVVRKLA